MAKSKPEGFDHPEDIKAAVRKKGQTLSGLERLYGITAGSCRAALQPRGSICGEWAISNFLKVQASLIWPKRYDGTSRKRRCLSAANA